MFVSQVIFESEAANEATLKRIVAGKLASARQAEGLVHAECWRQEKDEAVGYAFVSKWQSKEAFRAWFAESHRGSQGHKRPAGGGGCPALKKTGFLFEVVELDL